MCVDSDGRELHHLFDLSNWGVYSGIVCLFACLLVCLLFFLVHSSPPFPFMELLVIWFSFGILFFFFGA